MQKSENSNAKLSEEHVIRLVYNSTHNRLQAYARLRHCTAAIQYTYNMAAVAIVMTRGMCVLLK